MPTTRRLSLHCQRAPLGPQPELRRRHWAIADSQGTRYEARCSKFEQKRAIFALHGVETAGFSALREPMFDEACPVRRSKKSLRSTKYSAKYYEQGGLAAASRLLQREGADVRAPTMLATVALDRTKLIPRTEPANWRGELKSTRTKPTRFSSPLSYPTQQRRKRIRQLKRVIAK